MLVPCTAAGNVGEHGGPSVPASFPWECAGLRWEPCPEKPAREPRVPPWPVWGVEGVTHSLVDLFVCGCEQEQPQGTLVLPERLRERVFGAGAGGLRSWVWGQVVTVTLESDLSPF